MLNLSEDHLRQAMGIKPEPPKQTAMEFEKKQYIEWLRHRRARNSARADDAIANAANLIAGRIRKSGRAYNPWEFRELNDLLKQTTYLQRDLQTELDKENRLLDRWDQYRESSDGDRDSHEKYLRWCGCDPNSETEYRQLTQDIAVTELQIREADSLREALVDTAEEWQEQDRQRVFFFRQSGTLSKKDQLKQQLKAVRANRKKLEQIAFHCEEAAYRRIYKTEYLRKAAQFREQWHQKLRQEDALKARLRELREEERAEKRQAKSKK